MTKSRRGRATSALPSCGFDHLSLLSFVSMLGASAFGVVIAGKMHNLDYPAILPGVALEYHVNGSCTAESFPVIVKRAFVPKLQHYFGPERDLTDPKHWVLLIIDSGGGSLLHISVEFVMLC